MKKVIMFLFIVTLSVNADLTVKQIQEMVNKIHQQREGVKLETLDTTEEPFIRLEVNGTYVVPIKEFTEAKMILHAIVNGRAFVNDAWMNLGDNILGYQLMFIGKRGIVLRNENHIKKLFLRKKKDNFIKLEER